MGYSCNKLKLDFRKQVWYKPGVVADACTISTSEADAGEARLSYTVSVRLALATEIGLLKSERGEGGHGEQRSRPLCTPLFHTSLFMLRESRFE